MKSTFSILVQWLLRFLGVILLLTALCGMLFSVLGVFAVWRFTPLIANSAYENLDLLLKSLDVVDNQMIVAVKSVDLANKSLSNLDEIITTFDKSISTSTHFFDTAASLAGKDLPDTITNTQTALRSASNSAKFVDDVLTLVNSLPLIGGKYSTEAPLNQSLSQVADTLNNLPSTIKGMEDDFIEVKADMLEVQTKLADVHTQLQEITTSMNNVKGAVAELQSQTSEIHARVKSLREKLPGWVALFIYGVTFFLLWMTVALIGLVVQGVSLTLFVWRPVQPFAEVIIEPLALPRVDEDQISHFDSPDQSA